MVNQMKIHIMTYVHLLHVHLVANGHVNKWLKVQT